MISAISWVPRGAAKAQPVVAQPTEEELEATRVELLSRGDLDDADEQEEEDEDEDMDADDGEDDAVAHAKAAAAAIKSTKKGKSSSAVPTDGIEAAMKELDMEHYDDSDDDGIMARSVILC